MGGLFLRYYAKWKRFWAGEAPSRNHKIILGRILSFYNNIVLFLFYYLILTPIALVLRLSGKSFLPLKKSNWRTKKNKSNQRERY